MEWISGTPHEIRGAEWLRISVVPHRCFGMVFPVDGRWELRRWTDSSTAWRHEPVIIAMDSKAELKRYAETLARLEDA